MAETTFPEAGSRTINPALGIDWSNWDHPTHLAYSQRAMREFWPTAVMAPSARATPLKVAAQSLDLSRLNVGEPGTKRQMTLEQLVDRRMYNDALLIMHKGEVWHESYRNGMQETDLHVNHSTTKSLTTLLLALAVDDGLVDPLSPITAYIGELADLPAWRKISVQQALDMRTGLAYTEHYDDPDCLCWSYFRATGYYPPLEDTLPGYYAWIRRHMTELECDPGSKFNYASPITNALGLIAEAVYGDSVARLLEQKILRPLGAEREAWINLDPSGVAVTEGQLSLCLRDFARWAHLFLADGEALNGRRIVPASWFEDIVTPRQELRDAWRRGEYALMFPEGQYRNQTYVLDEACSQLAMLGIHGQFALIDRASDTLVVAYGSYPSQVDTIFVESLLLFWQAVRAALPTGQ
jgi:CubicO group peptidase (beta-lactamase class C family)